MIGWLRRSFDEARAVRDVYGVVEPTDIRRNALNIWGRVGADLRWVRAHGGPPLPALIARSLTHHLLRTAGALLGARAAALPDRWSERCRSSAEDADRSRPASLPAGVAAGGADGYPLCHGNRFRSPSGDDPGHRRSRREQDVPPARGAQAHSQGAGAAPAPPHPLSDVQSAATMSRSPSRAESSSGSPAATGAARARCSSASPGIYGADGQIWRRGRLSTLIELGVGFNMDMAARDNVVMNGIMLGLSPREARKRYDGVIEFAELQEFKDLKLKNYSSGMQVRLAFSVAIQVDADILMVDEVLAVGDAAFQQKCFDVFNDLRDRGRTIVFVTHDMGALQRFCHRALLLERGDPVYLGDPQEVADRYLELNFGRDPQSMGEAAEERSGMAKRGSSTSGWRTRSESGSRTFLSTNG